MMKIMTTLREGMKRDQSSVVEFTKAIADWDRAVEQSPRIARFMETYFMMALRAGYRPAADGDGCGGIYLSEEELNDGNRLADEALKYALAFDKEEDERIFHIGCSNFTTNRAFILAIEAARMLAGGFDGDPFALRLLELAAEEVRGAIKQRADKHETRSS